MMLANFTVWVGAQALGNLLSHQDDGDITAVVLVGKSNERDEAPYTPPHQQNIALLSSIIYYNDPYTNVACRNTIVPFPVVKSRWTHA
jgi:hypothetical protein